MTQHHGEMWHLYKILESLEKPATQMFVAEQSCINGFTAKKYLDKLEILGLVEKVKEIPKGYRKFNTRAKLWQITSKGKEFMKVISQYSKFGFDLK